VPQPGPFLYNGPRDSELTIVLAHGAGAPMDHPFLGVIAHGLGERGWRVARFEFPYMQKARGTGKRHGPNPAPVLLGHYAAVLDWLAERRGGDSKLVIGGKSMGGRIGSMLADAREVGGLVCLGYPFHPPGKPERLRVGHLERIQTPSLFVQGERDTFGTREEVEAYTLSENIAFSWMPDGDHSFKPRKSSGTTNAENLQRAVEAVDAYLKGLS